MSPRVFRRTPDHRRAASCATVLAVALIACAPARGDEPVGSAGIGSASGGIITVADGGGSRRNHGSSTPRDLLTDDDLAPGLLRPISMQPIISPQPQAPSTLPPFPSTDDDVPGLEPVPPITLTPLAQLTTSVAPPTGEMPRNHAADVRQDPTVLVGDPSQPIRTAAPFYSTPRTPDFVNRPLYFEERATERHGHSWGGAQPLVSAAHFYGTFFVLPYKMGAQPAFQRLNTGNGVVVPSDRYTLKQHLRGAAAQTGAVFGVIGILP